MKFSNASFYRVMGANKLPTLGGKWYYAGPFDNTDRAGFDHAYPPEKAVDLTARYTGTTSIKGMKVYTYVYEVPASKVGAESLPRSVFGLKGKGNVKADSMYQATVTESVEPTTGAIVDEVQDVKNWYSAQGNDLVTTAAKIGYTDAQVAKIVHDYKGQAAMLRLASGVVPWLVMIVGLVLVGVGFVSGRRRRA